MYDIEYPLLASKKSCWRYIYTSIVEKHYWYQGKSNEINALSK